MLEMVGQLIELAGPALVGVAVVLAVAVLCILMASAFREKPDYTPRKTWSDSATARAEEQAFRESEVPWYWKERKHG